ncbi:MAG: DNA polymerase III subunit delta' [Betaproteobacteria bacterium]|nr:DNA polymerase III subunit delta' [Betaproteobacteria bacterium]
MNPIPIFIERPLRSLLASRDTLHHALLFSGPEGVGKEWLARSLAAALLCDQPREDRTACGQCAACRWLSQDSHPDFRGVRPSADEPVAEEGESPSTRPAKVSRDIRIEQIRGLAGFVEVASHRGGAKVILITPADAMNSAAANALLKTLEEPPPNTYFLLVSSRSSRLPATVRSRCRQVPVPTPPHAEALAWVMAEARAEEERAQQWLAYCGGAPRRALDLGASEQAVLHRDLVETFANCEQESLVSSTDRLNVHEPRVWVPVLHAWCVDLSRCAASAAPRYFPAEAARLKTLATRVDVNALLDFELWLQQLQRLISHPLNPRLVADDALSRYLAVFQRRRQAA